jgi:hypothetical protein
MLISLDFLSQILADFADERSLCSHAVAEALGKAELCSHFSFPLFILGKIV